MSRRYEDDRGPPSGERSRRSERGDDKKERRSRSRDRSRRGSEKQAAEVVEPPKPKRSRFSAEPPPGAGGVMAAAAQMGLVPVVMDPQTKPRRELFIGNTPPMTTERALIDHLNAAMVTARLATGPGHVIISCRVSATFAFIELRSVQETDNAMSMTGIPFQGHPLKVGRPSKFEGPIHDGTTWQDLSLHGSPEMLRIGGGANVGGASSTPGGGGMPAMMESGGSLDPQDKSQRELFVGNTNESMTEGSIRGFLGAVAHELGQVIAPGDPIITLRLSGHYAFIELRSAQEAEAMMGFSGIPLQGNLLRIGRPSKYNSPSRATGDGPQWGDLLQSYRDGTLPPLHDGTHDLPQKKLYADDIALLAGLATDPTRVVRIVGVLDRARSVVQLENEQARFALDNGVLDDVRGECNKYGSVSSAEADGPDVVVVYALVDHAVLAVAALTHKRFMGQPFTVRFVRAGEQPQQQAPSA